MSVKNDTIRLGLVGLGKIARDQHLPALTGNADFRLIATASPGGRCDGVPGHDSLEEMLSHHPEIEAVALCTPPEARFALAQAAIAAGRHVLLEKPPAASLEQAVALRELALAKGCSLLASWHSRESECVDLAREWLLGKSIEHIVIDWREDIRRWHPGQTWILSNNGFGVFDPGINALSILTSLLPHPIEVAEAAIEIPANQAAPIGAQLDLRLGKTIPVSATFDFRNTGEQVWDIRIETGEGVLTLTHGGHRLAVNGQNVCDSTDREYPRLYHRFAALIRARQSDVDLRPLEIVLGALERGRRVTTASFDF